MLHKGTVVACLCVLQEFVDADAGEDLELDEMQMTPAAAGEPCRRSQLATRGKGVGGVMQANDGLSHMCGIGSNWRHCPPP